MKTRISVIIPIYNVREFLVECIDSVLEQSINDMELTDGYERNLQIILVDDGSTDGSDEIAKEYAENNENVIYVYEENQGLGHARNYGCEFAEGDYIIFLDSDDMVSPKAYERMYNLAVKNNSDMTIGSVWRFSSKGYWKEQIHEIAFNGKDEVSHIKENPKLFYDTTSWNKLIKKTFWDKHSFSFPEGILYEDIPVTIPMHYLANNVSIVYENCYLWRVREGLSKSITQTTDDLKNLYDRLTVMGMVDKFFDENVKEESLFKMKSEKWLNLDLMIFINKLKSVDVEDGENIINCLCDYIDKHINESDIDELNEFNRLRYKYLLEKDFDKLVDVLNFQYEYLKNSRLFESNGQMYLDVDNEDLFNTKKFCVDKYIREGRIQKYITGFKIKNDEFEVQGLTVIPGLKDIDFSDRKYTLWFYNSESHKKIELSVKDCKVKDLSEYSITYKDTISYEASGYKVSIPYDKIKDNPDFYGQNRILITFVQDDIEYNYFAGRTKNDIKMVTRGKAIVKGNTYISISYDLNSELIIDISEIKIIFDNLQLKNDKFLIDSPGFNMDMFLYYKADSINEEKKIKLDYDEDAECYSIDIKNISQCLGQIKYYDYSTAIVKEKKFMYFPSDNGQVIVNALRDFHLDLYKYDSISIVDKIKRTKKNIEFTADLYTSCKNTGKLISVNLMLLNKVNKEKTMMATGTIIPGTLNVSFIIDMDDEESTKDLYQGFHDITLEYEFENVKLYTTIFLTKPFNSSFITKEFEYKVYRSKQSALRIQSKRIPIDKVEGNLETRIKKSKWYRFLPINKKTIVFESMWGNKYSCNPRYLYEYIDKNFPDYKCVWSLTDMHTPIKGNGIRVRRLSLKYFYYMATAKYFVNNVNFHDSYVKRKGQIELQTMHGTPLKTLGLDVPGDFPTKKKEEDYINKCKRWDYLCVQSKFVGDISKSCFAFEKKLLNDGYPRTDILYTRNNQKDIESIKEKLGLPKDKKVILYAPTWRIKNKFDLMLDIEPLRRRLSKDYILILRLHQFSSKGWQQPVEDGFIYDLSEFDSVEELYLISDILITDYSSVMFDYSILDRPIILFTYDFEEYSEKLRGMYFDIKSIPPGPILYTSKEVEDAIANIDETEKKYGSLRKEFQRKFIEYESENSSKNIFDAMINHK